MMRDLLRAAALAFGALVAGWSLTSAGGLLGAVAGAALGAVGGSRLARTRVRTPALLAGAAGGALLGTALAALLVRWDGPSALFGPLRVRSAAEAVLWCGVAAAAALALRLLSERFRWGAALEIASLAAALASTVSAHRGGMVHRPLALADWAWSRGSDPVVLLLALGTATALFVSAVLMRERSLGRRVVHWAALLLLAGAALLVVRVTGTPQPRTASDLGLTGEPEREGEGRDGRGEGDPRDGGQGQGGGPPREGEGARSGELPFRNEYSTAGGDAPVAVVVFHDEYAPPLGYYYFRQTAFSQYNGVRLVQATHEAVDRDLPASFPVSAFVPADLPPAADRQSVRATVGLIADHVRPFALDALSELRPTANPDALRFRRTYQTVSRAPTWGYESLVPRPAGAPGWSREVWAHYTEYPRGDRRYGDLAGRIASRLAESHRTGALARALAVKVWLEKNGTYSRRSVHAEQGDPTASFLFGDLTGYCVHFAHAAAYLMRALGLPARVAGGYAVEEGRRGGGSTVMIRGVDAHAWPEVYLEGAGWVIVDIAPERVLDPPDAAADTSLQRRLGETLRNGPPEAEPPGAAAPTVDWRDVARVLAGLLLAALLGSHAVKFWRQVAPELGAPREAYRLAYRAALDRLAEVGLRRRFGETRESFAARAAAIAPSFAVLTPYHLAGALGSRAALDAGELRRLARAVAREAAAAVPAWKFLLGRLDPTAHWRSR